MHPSRCSRILFYCCAFWLVLLLGIQIYITVYFSRDRNTFYSPPHKVLKPAKKVQFTKNNQLTKLFEDAAIKLVHREYPLGVLEIDKVSPEISRLNEQQTIYNLQKFGPVNPSTTKVIVIQMFTRINYLVMLLQSLSKVQGINDSLLIFSHDVFLPELNDAIRKLEFARVVQIFFPNSVQLNPHNFPGPESDPFEQERYKEYRGNGRLTQVKHHWWWKANFVFDNLTILENYTGVISFISDNAYFTPDAFWALDKMKESVVAYNICRSEDCSIFSLVRNQNPLNAFWDMDGNSSSCIYTNTVHVLNPAHVGFNRNVWQRMKGCVREFCEYGDNKWFMSLYHLANSTCMLPYFLNYTFPNAERIFNIDNNKCRRLLHYSDSKVNSTVFESTPCHPEEAVRIFEEDIMEQKELLFPNQFNVTMIFPQKDKKKKKVVFEPYGWGDRRDQSLCLSFSGASIRQL